MVGFLRKAPVEWVLGVVRAVPVLSSDGPSERFWGSGIRICFLEIVWLAVARHNVFVACRFGVFRDGFDSIVNIDLFVCHAVSSWCLWFVSHAQGRAGLIVLVLTSMQEAQRLDHVLCSAK